MHATRREAVENTVFAAIRGGKLTVTVLGRSMERMTKEKHYLLSTPALKYFTCFSSASFAQKNTRISGV